MTKRTHSETCRGREWLGRAAHGWVWHGMGSRGRVDGRQAGFDSLLTHPRGRARRGGAMLGKARRGLAWQGIQDGWLLSGFDAPNIHDLGWARHGKAGSGSTRLGAAWLGVVPVTEVGHGLVPWSTPATRAWLGSAGLGMAGSGMARRCWEGDRQTPRFKSSAFSSLGSAGSGSAVHGGPGHGVARRGMEGDWQPSGFEALTPAPLSEARMGTARRGRAGHGSARQGEVGVQQTPGCESPAPTHMARLGEARLRVARQGSAWHGRVRTDGRSAGSTPAPSTLARLGRARQRMALRGSAGLGPVTAVGSEYVSLSSAAPGRQFVAWRGVAGRCSAGLGKARETVVAPGVTPGVSSASGWSVAGPGTARLGKSGLGAAWLGVARRGPVAAVAHGLVPWASPALGQAWHGVARRSMARLGMAGRGVGDGPGPRSRTSVLGCPRVAANTSWQGQVGPGGSRLGGAWRGVARQRRAGSGLAGPGMGFRADGLVCGSTPQRPLIVARPGMARHGRVRRGMAGRGLAWVSQRADGLRRDSTPRGPLRLSLARRGSVWPAMARPGEAWVYLGRSAHSRSSSLRRPLIWAWLVEAGRGAAMRGVAGVPSLLTWSFLMFETKGSRPEWLITYEALAKLAPGDVLTFETLDELLGRDFRDFRGPIYRAAKELESKDRRTVDSIRGVGYRVVEAREHEGLARRHHKRSRRQLGKAVAKAASADRSALTVDERKRIDGLEMSLRQHAQMIRRLEQRDEQREQQIKSLRRDTTADVAALSERVDRLAELLERHGVEAQS